MHHDTGFAPHIEGSLCFLSGCKCSKTAKRKNIEEAAQQGTWIIGIGGNLTKQANKIIYIMEVQDNINREQFRKKYPKQSKYINPNHVGTRVLVSDNFYYFGDNAIEMPKNLKHLIISRQGSKLIQHFEIDRLKNYLMTKKLKPGNHGKPNNTDIKDQGRALKKGKKVRLIFSRKGFDSSYGGSPSPILEDGTIISLPIPAEDCDKKYSIRYRDLRPQGVDLGKLIDDLATKTSKGNVSSKDFAHFDPDICDNAYHLREPGWRGLFGQCLAAQGHLRNQSVGIGDLFLFYGLYHRVKKTSGNYVYDKSSRPIHLIWGWLQVGDIVDIAGELRNIQLKYPWASYHPHYHFQKQPANNTLYIASEELSIEGFEPNKTKGFGVFRNYREELQLSDPDNDKTSYWRLPNWMYQENKLCPLSYNTNREWKLENGFARLKSFTRGQEYVCDVNGIPDALIWLESLLT